MRFTRTSISNLKLSSNKKDYEICWDDTLPGFGVRINPTNKVWVVQYRVKGKSRRHTLGRVDTISLDAARETARNLLARVQLGADPHEDKRQQDKRRSISFKLVSERYLAGAKNRLKPRSYQEVFRHLNTHAAPFQDRPIVDLNRASVSALLEDVAKTRGPIASNRVRASLSALFTYALSMGFADLNPVSATIKFGDEIQRDRVLENQELARIWRSCIDNDHGRIVKLLLLTAQRREEVGGMRWSELKLQDNLWIIPGERTKNRRTHEVPLSTMAIDILASTPRTLNQDHVFGSRATGFSGWSKAKIELDERIAGDQTSFDWRLHDLRRTAATGMASLNIQPHIIEAVLNHISGHRAGVAGIYNRASYRKEKQAALSLWSKFLKRELLS